LAPLLLVCLAAKYTRAAVQNSNEVARTVRQCDQAANAPIEGSKVPDLELPTLGRPVVLGELYSTHSEQLLPSMSLWDQATIDKHTIVNWIPSSKTDFKTGESKDESHENLGINAAMSVSLDGGLIKGSGSAKYLEEKKNQDNIAQVRLSYISQTRAEVISSCLTGISAPRCPAESLNGPYAPTHVVTQIVYGGNAHFLFEKEVKDDEDKIDVQGSLDLTINLEITKAKGNANLNFTQNNEDFKENIRIKTYSDFILERQPIILNETIALFKNISTHLGSKENMFNQSVPMKMTLLPISQLCPSSGAVDKVDEYIFKEATSIYNSLLQTTDDITNLLTTYAAVYNFQLRELLLDFRDKVSNYTVGFGGNISKIIPLVRSNPEYLHNLTKIISDYEKTCFNADTLTIYLMERTREVNALNIFYGETVNKVAPKMAQYQNADVPAALLTKKYVFVLSLHILPNIEDEKFDCSSDNGETSLSWYDDPKDAGQIGHLWRKYISFFNANFNITTAGMESAYFVEILNGERSFNLELYLNGEYNGTFVVPEVVKLMPRVCRKVKGSLLIYVDNPKDVGRIIQVAVGYKLSSVKDTSLDQPYTTIVVDLDTQSDTTLVNIPNIDSQESYNFTVSFVTKYGFGPSSKVFQSFGELDELKTKPRCLIDSDTKFNRIQLHKSDITVDQCSQELLSKTLQSKSSSYSGTSLWNYDFSTKKCYYTMSSNVNDSSELIGWAAGSFACGANDQGSEWTWTHPEETKFKLGKILTILPLLPKQFLIEFEVIQKKGINGGSGIQFTVDETNDGCCEQGSRIPAMWFYPNEIHFKTAFNSHEQEIDAPITPNKWTNIKFSQFLEGGDYIYRIMVDDKVVFDKTPVKQFSSVSVYAGVDPTLPVQEGSVKNVKVFDSSFKLLWSHTKIEMFQSNKTLGTLPKIEEEFYIEMEVIATKRTTNKFAAGVHFTTENKFCCDQGSRIPGVFFTPTGLYITQSFHGFQSTFETDLSLNQWTKLEFSQVKLDGDFIYRVSMDGVEVYRHTPLKDFHNVKVYAGTPWHSVQDGSFRNMKVTIPKLSDCEVPWSPSQTTSITPTAPPAPRTDYWVSLATGHYLFYTSPATQQEGQKMCESKGGKLLEVNTEEEYETVIRHIDSLFHLKNTTNHFWMGSKSNKEDKKCAIIDKGQLGMEEVDCGRTEYSICELDWTVIQRRGQYGNSKDFFYRVWTEYVKGFGNPEKEYWIGLNNITKMTSSYNMKLRVELTDYQGKKYIAAYDNFKVGSQDEDYKLHVSGYDPLESTIQDSLKVQNGSPFTTFDRDNDAWSDQNCAQVYKGAWWYKACHATNLNGWNFNKDDIEAREVDNKNIYAKGIIWLNDDTHDHYFSWPHVEMKIKRKM